MYDRAAVALTSIAIVLGSATLGRSDTPYIVQDIRTPNDQSENAFWSYMAGGVAVGSSLYFVAEDGLNGCELWRSDGTPSGTMLMRDIGRDPDGGCPDFLTALGSGLFFSATDGSHGIEPWFTDGTSVGTRLIRDVWPGMPSGMGGSNAVGVGSSVLFYASDGVNSGLWKSDGTPAGTVLVKSPLSVGYPVSVGGTAFFPAGDELWKSDGTEAGTAMVKDILPGPESSFPHLLTSANNLLFFVANDGTHGPELWRSDGSEAGTFMLTDLGAGHEPGLLTQADGKIFFVMSNATSGLDLWKSDGTVSGTAIVKTIPEVANLEMAAAGSRLFFRNMAPTPQLWTSDGTSDGTVPIKDVVAFSLAAVGPDLFFSGYDAGTGQLSGLWKSDGTPTGTVLVHSISPYTLIDVAGTLFFQASDLAGGRALWKSDGTAGGTVLVKALATLGASSFPSALACLNDRVFFSAGEALHGDELWSSDGSAPGTRMVQDIAPGPGSSSPADTIQVGNSLFFTANDAQLWKTPGRGAPTALVLTPTPQTPFKPRWLTPVDHKLYFVLVEFAGPGGPNWLALWKSDGTSTGTRPLLSSGSGPRETFPLARVGSHLFFGASSTPFQPELWKTDGTARGTIPVKEVAPTPLDLDNGIATAADVTGTLLFYANNSELWRSDGTTDGTVLVENLREISSRPFRSPLVAMGAQGYFLAGNDDGERYLWRSDGTSGGTEIVAHVGSFQIFPLGDLVATNGKLFFVGYSQESGHELWISDGTASGTHIVMDIVPGSESGLDPLAPISVAGPAVVFAAAGAATGTELWTSDGSEEGTRMFGDINPGPGSSNPHNMVACGKNVYFAAHDGETGYELWAAPLVTEVISIHDAVVVEVLGHTVSARFLVSLSRPTNTTITVDFATSDDTASNGVDYGSVSGTLTFPPGSTRRFISVPVYGDSVRERKETFFVTLTNAAGAPIADDQGVGTIYR